MIDMTKPIPENTVNAVLETVMLTRWVFVPPELNRRVEDLIDQSSGTFMTRNGGWEGKGKRWTMVLEGRN